MTLRQIFDQFGKDFKPDQELLQRIINQFLPAQKHLIENLFILFDMTQQKGARQFVLILEVIEKSAFGDASLADELLDRGCAKSLVQHRGFGNFEDTVAGALTLALGLL